MKTYKFFYFDSYKGHKRNDFREYVISSSRFDSAFKAFCNFLSFHSSGYIAFDYAYMVSNDFRTQARSLTYRDILYLVSIKDKHNATFWETFNEEQIH